MADTSRDLVLRRIRAALRQPAPAAAPRPDFAAPLHPRPGPNEDLAVAFAQSFVRVGGEFYYCESSTISTTSSFFISSRKS
ncbi:hypothetical protein [Hymenobacter amundsenii]|uniref:hypothetical protein n=1 Tax=Hymenobacter amundsenii TaxID=2006685 RepID=UPI001F5BDF0D|nr:hypothetical protein [Hymenobacter amundsenii]